MADATLVAFSEVVDADPTLFELSDLPPGWIAWREDVGSQWKRRVADSDSV